MQNVDTGSRNLGAKTGFLFMGSSILLLGLAWLWIPETRGLSTEEIDSLYERGMSPRKFERVKRDGERLDREAEKVMLTSWSQKSEKS
jgi:hypothetical protein